MDSAALWAKSTIPFLILVLFAAAIPRLPTAVVFTPSRRHLFKYRESMNPGNGTGNDAKA